MDVHKLDCGPEEQKQRDEPSAQISNPRVLWTNSTDSSHDNCHYSSGLQVCQSIKRRLASSIPFGLGRYDISTAADAASNPAASQAIDAANLE
jgi:hypothetical protein